jgi:hypothetical protein
VLNRAPFQEDVLYLSTGFGRGEDGIRFPTMIILGFSPVYHLPSRQVLGPTQPLVQWVKGRKRPGRGNCHSKTRAEIKYVFLVVPNLLNTAVTVPFTLVDGRQWSDSRFEGFVLMEIIPVLDTGLYGSQGRFWTS